MTSLRPGLLRCLAALSLGVLPRLGHAEDRPEPVWGVALSSRVNGEVTAMRVVPSATLRLGRGQLEAGVGVHPWIRTDQRIWSGELGAKHFPNGTDDKLGLYVHSRLSYVHNRRETFYPTTYHYLFVLGGYGLTVRNANGFTVGTDVAIGPYTFARESENPYPGFESDGLFDEVGWTLAFQFDLAYQF